MGRRVSWSDVPAWGLYILAWIALFWDAVTLHAVMPGVHYAKLFEPTRMGFALVLVLAALARKFLRMKEAIVLVSLVLLGGLAYQAATAAVPSNLFVVLESQDMSKVLPEGISNVGGGKLVFRYSAVPGALIKWGFHVGDSLKCPLDQRYANIHGHLENLTLGEIDLEEVDEVKFCASVRDRKEDFLFRAMGSVHRLSDGEYAVMLNYREGDLGYERELLFLIIGLLAGDFLNWLRRRLKK
ncbi:MAG: hypothetical protein QI223_05240 [Candidatus Korarchaeota archaeon]|nr:hypothetical protein [Candidatus Korarchaeota archaeon]